MNILFVTMFQISEQKGGTERTTARISNELHRRGHRCFNLYAKPIGDTFEMTKFDGIYKDCSANAIKNIIDIQKIDKIIIEGAFILVKNVSEGRSKAFYKPRMFFVHHFAPGYEPYFNAFSSIWKQMLYAQSTANKMKAFVKVLIYPLFKPYMDASFHKLYKTAYSLCDKVVLLSPEYANDYCKFGDIKDKTKFVSIPNAVSFDEFISINGLKNKQKTVLVVTRLDEVQKRISLAIEIWKRIEEDADLKDWNFKIVGFGESEHEYRRLISHLSLKRIFLEGRQNPIRYYKESSLFVMTSLFEGWPMTLNESLQFGCVPFVYDTCASFHEIINNGENGFLIADKDEEDFYHKMREVMLNGNRRMELMKAAVESSTRFTLDKIVTQWEKLLNE